MKLTPKEAAQTTCDIFNRQHPVGTEVNVRLDSGKLQHTETTSEAYVSESGSPVIFMKDVRGFYLLSRVTPA